MRVVAIIPAAGAGKRLGAGIPKALFELEGQTLLERAIRGLIASDVIDEVYCAISAQMRPQIAQLGFQQLPPSPSGRKVPVRFADGGAERADSVFSAMRQAISHAGMPDVFVVHDAARALTPPEMIARVVQAVSPQQPAVIPGLPVADTIKVVADSQVTATPDRSSLRAIQTPQAADAATLVAANEKFFALEPDSQDFVPTDDASLLEWAGVPVTVVDGDPRAMKVTTPQDIAIAKLLLQ